VLRAGVRTPLNLMPVGSNLARIRARAVEWNGCDIPATALGERLLLWAFGIFFVAACIFCSFIYSVVTFTRNMITGDSMNAIPAPIFVCPKLPSGVSRPARLLRYSQVTKRSTEWLWPQRIALGKVTVLVGEMGIGKGSVAVDFAARVSRGKPWPNQTGENSAAGTAIVVCPPDERQESMPARLEAAGADLERICAIETDVQFERPDDAPELNIPILPAGEAARVGDPPPVSSAKGPKAPPLMAYEFGALRLAIESTPDCKLVVIDPISVYLRDPESRRSIMVQMLLEGLEILAKKHQVAIVVVAHLSGRASMQSIERTLGTFGPPSGSRNVWGVFRNRADAGQRLMLRLDGNWAEECEALSFKLDRAEKSSVPRVEWGTSITISAEKALAGSSKFSISEQHYHDTEQYVTERLRELVSDSPRRVQLLKFSVGASEAQLYRAAERIGVIKRKDAYEWHWMLPEHVSKWEERQRREQADRAEARRQRKNQRAQMVRREKRNAENAAMMAVHSVAERGTNETGEHGAMKHTKPSQKEAVTSTRSKPRNDRRAPPPPDNNCASDPPWREKPPSIFERPHNEFEVDLSACSSSESKPARCRCTANSNDPSIM
jgi:hypothetical protein